MENIERPDPRIENVVERLRLAHSILSRDQFLGMLQSGELEIWQIPDLHILVQWGYTGDGRVLHILTATGTMDRLAEGWAAIERGAIAGGAVGILCVAAPGWAKSAMVAGYTAQPKVLLTKVLKRDTDTTH